MCSNTLIFLTRERRNWMRLRTHTVIFDSERDFAQHRQDPTGAIMRILHIWLADPVPTTPVIRAYLGSIRFSSGWYSRRELLRLFQRASASAQRQGESPALLRHCLSRFLRDYFRL